MTRSNIIELNCKRTVGNKLTDFAHDVRFCLHQIGLPGHAITKPEIIAAWEAGIEAYHAAWTFAEFYASVDA